MGTNAKQGQNKGKTRLFEGGLYYIDLELSCLAANVCVLATLSQNYCKNRRAGGWE